MGECFFWYRPTRVVPDQRPLNGRCCCLLLLFEQIAGLSGPVGEMIQATGDIGTQWILDLSNGIAKELWLPV